MAMLLVVKHVLSKMGVRKESIQVFAVVSVAYILTTCPCFDIPKFDIFDAVVLSATLPRLDCVAKTSMCPLTRWCKTFYWFSDFYPCSIGTKLARGVTLMVWLNVPNNRYHFSSNDKIKMLSVYQVKLYFVCYDQSRSFNVQPL